MLACKSLVQIRSNIFRLSCQLMLVLTIGLCKGQYLPADDNRSSLQTPARELANIHRDLRRLERETSRASSDEDRVKNIVSLCGLFVEIGQHPDIARSPTLQSLSVRLRTRLRGTERRTIKELKRRGIPEPDPDSATSFHRDSAYVRAGSSGAESPSKWKQRLDPPGSQRGHAAPMPDYGWDLVNLIRQTIRPDYWSVAGGPGKALYFGQARALVIHGSWRVQEDVADLLAALRGY